MRVFRSIRVAAAAAALAGGVIFAVGPVGSAVASNTTTRHPHFLKTVSITGVMPIDANAFFETMCLGARAAAKKFDVNLTWTGTPGDDIASLANAIEAAATKNPDGMLTDPVPSNTAYISLVKSLMKQHIYFIDADNSLTKHVDVTNVRSNNALAAQQAAKALGQLIGGKGSVAVVSLAPGGSQSILRVNSFVSGMHHYWPKVQVLPTQYDNHDVATAANIVSALIQSHPNLAAVYTIEDAGGDGAASAIKAAGKTGKIKVVTFDADPELVAGLRSGQFDMLVAQYPYGIGYTSVQILAEVARGQRSPTSFPTHVQVGYKIITRANLNSPSTQPYLYKAVGVSC